MSEQIEWLSLQTTKPLPLKSKHSLTDKELAQIKVSQGEEHRSNQIIGGGYNHWTGLLDWTTGLLDWTTGLTQTAKYTSFSAE